MTGEIEFFRKRFVGGFNRQDVINYISKLAKERNDYRVAKEKAEQEAQELADENARLRTEIEAAMREAREGREYKATTLAAAATTFSELEASFLKLYNNFREASRSVCEDIDKARETVTSLPSVLEHAGESFRELQAICNAERDAPEGGETAASDEGGGAEGCVE